MARRFRSYPQTSQAGALPFTEKQLLYSSMVNSVVIAFTAATLVRSEAARRIMGLALVLVYIALNLLSPAEMFPVLGPYRPILILALASVPPTLITRLGSPEIGKLRTQPILMFLFFAFACSSWFPHGGLGANLDRKSVV